MESLIKKYDRPGPRYTSYPPLPFWKHIPDEADWISQINNNLIRDPKLDLYLHVPFCEQLCYYCGCNRIITKDKSREKEYTRVLLKEWNNYLKHISEPFSIQSVHFGGGTPTFLSPESLGEILSVLKPRMASDFIGAIEIDPRTCLPEHLEVLKSFGIKRISLGIQDFDPVVQKKINRMQSFELVENLCRKIRQMNFESLNFDLIYGLPGQTVETISKTFEFVTKLNPDTIAFYSYAHLPEKIVNQRLIKDSDLPRPDEKIKLYLHGQELLKDRGYLHIGMDHFALPGSFLLKELTRSFMGYTDKKSTLLIGLGPSAIGSGTTMYVQNKKDLREYQEDVNQDKLPLSLGHKLSREEQSMSETIQELFCLGEVHFADGLQVRADMKEFELDGLVDWKNNNHMKVTELGKLFLRNIAMAIDPLLKSTTTRNFSRTV